MTTRNRIEREARLRWVPIALMRVSPMAQRELKQHRVDRLASNFDLEQLGTPTVSERDGHFYIVDGQHRIEALREIGWGDQQIQCFVWTGLTEKDEAERFLKLNDTLLVDAYSSFQIAVHAEREMETDIARVVAEQEMVVSRDSSMDNSVSAVGTLIRVYKRGGPEVLGRTLRIVRDSYGRAGQIAIVIDGIGLLCDRYNGVLEDQVAVAKLGKVRGGVNGLLGRAEIIRRASGQPKATCVAAAAVELINAGRGGVNLPSWWKEAS